MEEALQDYREALAIWQKLDLELPQDSWRRRNEALAQCLIGKVLLAQGLPEPALDHFRKATAIQKDLADSEPDAWGGGYRQQLAYGVYQTGLALHQAGQSDAALLLLKQARDLQAPLVSDKPGENIWWERDLALIDLALAKVYHWLKYTTEALRCWEQARAAFQRLADENPPVHEFRRGLAAVYLFRGAVLIERGRWGGANDDLRRTRQLCQVLCTDNPEVTENQTLLAESEEGLAQVHQARREQEQAQECQHQAESIWRKLDHLHPKVPEFRRGLDRSRQLLGKR
jgi:tetratricopeptide (TPR) repeat protein